MNEPLVSVNMITYNHLPYIARAIEGVINQRTDFPFELIIGEDCSIDGTREIVFDYAKRYPDIIRVVTSDCNVGMRKNSIRTMQECRGKYIAICEGDDYWHNMDKLQKQADYLEAHPNCGLVFSEHDRIYERTGKRLSYYFRSTNNIPPAKFNVFKRWGDRRTFCNMTPCTVMVRKSLWLGIISSYPYNSDEYIGGGDVSFCEIALVSNVHYIEESMATYTVRIESACRSRDPKRIARFNLSVAEAYLYIARKYKQDNDVPYLTKKWVNSCLRSAFWGRNPSLARTALAQKELFGKADWLFYFGSVSRIAHFVLYPIAYLYRSIWVSYIRR